MSEKINVEEVSTAVELAIKDCGIAAIQSLPKFQQAVRMAKGIAALREALTDQFVRHALMPLMNSPLGFLTDRPNDKPYPISVVRDCCIEAAIRGFNWVGNEFNIISERFYGAKNGYDRLVREFPGLTNLALRPGVAQLAGDRGALVPYTATWLLNGRPMSLECQQVKDGPDERIPVKVNAGMGQDAILGKAERKILFRVHKRLYGSTFSESEGEPDIGGAIVTTGEPAPSPVPESAPEGRRYSLKGKKQSTPGDSGVATNGAAAASDARPSNPPPARTAPAAAPADPPQVIDLGKALAGSLKPVDVGRLVQMLCEIDARWDDPGLDARETVESWSEPERAEAFKWCHGYLTNVERNIRRPAHTIIGREPGEEG